MIASIVKTHCRSPAGVEAALATWRDRRSCINKINILGKVLVNLFHKLADYGSIWNYYAVQTLTESVVEQGLAERILSEEQLERLVGGEAARRYGLVNRALKAK